jgi:hypothetical protein
MIDGFARVLNHRLPALSKRAALPLAVALSILLFGGRATSCGERQPASPPN